MRAFYVHIMASRRNGTLYVGMTDDLPRRILEHKFGSLAGFTAKYGIRMLVYYEVFDAAYDAILREKRIKKWKRQWKLELIEHHNPGWKDLCSAEGVIDSLPSG